MYVALSIINTFMGFVFRSLLTLVCFHCCTNHYIMNETRSFIRLGHVAYSCTESELTLLTTLKHFILSLSYFKISFTLVTSLKLQIKVECNILAFTSDFYITKPNDIMKHNDEKEFELTYAFHNFVFTIYC